MSACGKNESKEAIISSSYQEEQILNVEETKEPAIEPFDVQKEKEEVIESEKRDGLWIGGIEINPMFYDVISEFLPPNYDYTLLNNRTAKEYIAACGEPVVYYGKGSPSSYLEFKLDSDLSEVIKAEKEIPLKIYINDGELAYVELDSVGVTFYHALKKQHMLKKDFVATYFERDQDSIFTVIYRLKPEYKELFSNMTYTEFVELTGDTGFLRAITPNKDSGLEVLWFIDELFDYGYDDYKEVFYMTISFDPSTGKAEINPINENWPIEGFFEHIMDSYHDFKAKL